MFNLIDCPKLLINRINGLFVCLNVDICTLSFVKIAFSEECGICKRCSFASAPSSPTLFFLFNALVFL